MKFNDFTEYDGCVLPCFQDGTHLCNDPLPIALLDPLFVFDSFLSDQFDGECYFDRLSHVLRCCSDLELE